MDKECVREMINIMRKESAKHITNAKNNKECGDKELFEISEVYGDFFNTLTELNEARS